MATVSLFSMSVHADPYDFAAGLLQSRKFPQVLNYTEDFLSKHPRDPQMRHIRGIAQSESGDTAGATTTFRKLTEDHPGLAEAWNNLGVLLASRKEYLEARLALEEAIRSRPGYATAHENLGDIFLELAVHSYLRSAHAGGNSTRLQSKLTLIKSVPTRDAPAAPRSLPAVQQVQSDLQPPFPAKTTDRAPARKTALGAMAMAAPISASPKGKPPAKVSETPRNVEAAVRAWALAWSNKDMRVYFDSYTKDFTPEGGKSRRAWEQERNDRIVNRPYIKVEVSDFVINVDGDKASAKFWQRYSTENLQQSTWKKLSLVKLDERWAISREASAN